MTLCTHTHAFTHTFTHRPSTEGHSDSVRGLTVGPLCSRGEVAPQVSAYRPGSLLGPQLRPVQIQHPPIWSALGCLLLLRDLQLQWRLFQAFKKKKSLFILSLWSFCYVSCGERIQHSTISWTVHKKLTLSWWHRTWFGDCGLQELRLAFCRCRQLGCGGMKSMQLWWWPVNHTVSPP